MARSKKKPANAPVHIVQRWTSSPVVYGLRGSAEPSENPDYHAPIALTSRGTFVTDAGSPIDPKDVPAYIREVAKKADLNIEYRRPAHRELTMTDAMLGAGVQDTDPDPRVRASRGRVQAIA